MLCEGDTCWSGLPKDLVNRFFYKLIFHFPEVKFNPFDKTNLNLHVCLMMLMMQECAMMTGLIIMAQTSSLMCGACTTLIR